MEESCGMTMALFPRRNRMDDLLHHGSFVTHVTLLFACFSLAFLILGLPLFPGPVQLYNLTKKLGISKKC